MRAGPPSAARLVALGVLAASSVRSRAATADVPFVDRPVTLPPLHVSADVGVGFGQWDDIEIDPTNPQGTLDSGTKIGSGANLEAHLGLPYFGEIGVRVGYRFDSSGAYAQADHFARLFDPVVNEPGTDAMTNPEVSLRGTLLTLPFVEMALETRAILPTAASSDFALTLGAPVRIHVPTFARIDTGLYVPLSFTSPAAFAIEVPAQLFFQLGDSFLGPLTGLLFVQNGGDPNPQIVAGVGGGHTFGGHLDVKGQVFTTQINDVNWARHVGAGLGIGLLL